MKKTALQVVVAAAALLLAVVGCRQTAQRPADSVNPLVGTDGHGHTFPGAIWPFGMVQLSPDTRLDGWDGCSAYHYSDSLVYGFSHTHLSGTGCSDYGDVLLMPTTGALHLDNAGYASRFSHGRERAEAGYYAVVLDDYGVEVELTTTPRVGLHRYSFPKAKDAHVVLDLVHRDKVLASSLSFNGRNEITGYRRSQAWADDQRLYFVIQFSRDFTSHGVEVAGDRQAGVLFAEGESLKAWMDFDMSNDNSPLLVKVALSAVSIEGARRNLEAELAGWDFETARHRARTAWDEALACIAIEGGSRQERANFYTALYHCMTAPNIYNDVDGQYRGRDLQVHRADHDYYTVFSLWDTYRALHPLMTIIDEGRTNDFVKTFLRQWDEGGLLPVWELSSCETNCMIGYHAVPVIADAYMKGIRGYDTDKALAAMKTSAMADHFGLSGYKAYGYVPADQEGESVSKTLEYAYDDWCIATVAQEMGRSADADYYFQRAQSYKNVFDPSTGFMRARYSGKWFAPFDPREVNFNYTEANAWQYNFYVPQDINTLIRLHGGDSAFCAMIDRMLAEQSETTGRQQADITGLIGQYAHGNEPSHHMAYLYNYAGQPWKTQALVRQIMKEMYQDSPDGLCGNEDCGQMSAWYVFSAMGFYPVTPADNRYAIGSPLFDKATIHLENGNTFSVEARNNTGRNVYIQSATLNGQPYNKGYITHDAIRAGGTLCFVMGDTPNPAFGLERPTSEIAADPIIPSPFVAQGDRTFLDSTTIVLGCIEPGAEIFYGTKPAFDHTFKRYEHPLTVSQNTTLYIVARKDGKESRTVETLFSKIPRDLTIALHSTYANQYSAGGDNALIDQVRGGTNFRTGSWQGFQAQDVVAVVDLHKSETLSYLSLGCIQDQKAWIVMPSQVEFFLSDDGKTFRSAGVVPNTVPIEEEKTVIKDFELKLNPTTARYVKVVATNAGKLPAWHLGAGGDSWIFVDELVIK